jgi:hypothetical protein
MSDLWTEASLDHERLAREAALARADAELDGIMPFLLASRSDAEYSHRSALAGDAIAMIAAVHGLEAAELLATAARRYRLYREALQEGVDPLDEVVENCGQGHGSGPEKPDEHSTGPDLSHGYSEVPAGPPGGPASQVTQPRPPRIGPVSEPTASLHKEAGQGMMTPGYQPVPPGTGTGAGLVDTGVPTRAAGMTLSLPAGATGSGQVSMGTTTPVTPPPIGQVTSSTDPVRRKVMAVTAAIRESNGHLPEAECERVARVVVGRYLAQADLSSSVVSDDPGGSTGNSGGGGGGESGGMSGPEEFLLGRSLIKAAPELLAAL